MNAARKMTLARTSLVLEQPFFGILALKLKMVEDPTCPTAWVDGVRMGYNPRFIETLTHAECVGLVAHEVMHCANGHPWRRGGRDHRRFNVACDRVINPLLEAAGFVLPHGALGELDPSHAGKSAEWVYARLPVDPPPPPREDPQDPPGTEDPPEDPPGDEGTGGPGQDPGDTPADDEGGPGAGEDGEGTGDGAGEPGDPQGEVRDAPSPGEDPDAPTEVDWKQAVEQAAAAAAAQGKLPGAMERAAKMATAPVVDWRSVLRRFVQQAATADYSWTRPNPRYLHQRLYLPALRSVQMGPLAVAIDTSGSIDEVLLGQFAAEIQGIMDESRPERCTVMYADSRVQRVDTFEQDEPFELHPAGGGGTDFRPVFNEVRDMDEPPVALIYLTDLLGSFPAEEGDVPTLWLSTRRAAAPFGETVYVE